MPTSAAATTAAATTTTTTTAAAATAATTAATTTASEQIVEQKTPATAKRESVTTQVSHNSNNHTDARERKKRNASANRHGKILVIEKEECTSHNWHSNGISHHDISWNGNNALGSYRYSRGQGAVASITTNILEQVMAQIAVRVVEVHGLTAARIITASTVMIP